MKNLFILVSLSLLILTQAFSQSCLPDGIIFTSQTQIDNFQNNYPGCTKIEGDVHIESNTITNLNGLSSLNSIGESLLIHGNKMLKEIDGLINLDSIGEYLNISFGVSGQGNLSLQNIHGFENLQFVGKGIRVSHCDSLVDLTGLENIDSTNLYVRIGDNPRLQNLKGIENLTYLNGDLVIEYNNSLTSLLHLTNLSSINGMFYISYNDRLKSLEGLENIDSETITEVWIKGNDSLSFCEINSVCGYLADTNNTIAGIWENDLGCNSRIEVENACTVGYEIKPNFEEYITIYPNPAKDVISILITKRQIIKSVSIFNLYGQHFTDLNYSNDKIDISKLESGIYILEIITDRNKLRKKLIKR